MAQSPKPVTSPVPESLYPTLTVLMLTIGLVFTTSFFIHGCEVSVKDLDSLLSLLVEKKKIMVQDEAEANMQIMLEFLHCLRKQKVEELKQIQSDLMYITEDISAVESHRTDLYQRAEIKRSGVGGRSNPYIYTESMSWQR